MELKQWDFEADMIVLDCPTLFDETEKTAKQYMGSAYAVNTATGIYYQHPREFGDLYFDLICVDREGAHVCMEEMVVVASNMNYTAMIIHEKQSGNNYLLDTRGVLYFLDSKIEDMDPAQYRFKFDKKTGFYSIAREKTWHLAIEKFDDLDDAREWFEAGGDDVRWMLRGKSKKEMFMFMLDSAADPALELNPKMKSFLSKGTKQKCLYLTLPRNAKGTKEAWLLQNLEHEVLPNIFFSDKSVNLRIPYSESNLSKKEFHYLASKHENTYAIQETAIKTLIACLDLDWKLKEKDNLLLAKPTEKAYATGTGIINTLKSLMELKDDTEVYKKVFKKILNLYEKGEAADYENYFEAFRVPYPKYNDNAENVRVLKERRAYITEVLQIKLPNSLESLKESEITALCKAAYKASNEKRKAELSTYEKDAWNDILKAFKFPY